MNNLRKIAFLAMMGAAVLTSCRKDETVDLAGIPASRAGLSISDAPEQTPDAVALTATYDGEGKVQVSGAISRTYTISLVSPSPEDLSFDIEPIITNIPAEKVTLSETHLTIPAGSKSASVEVTLADEDFSFVEEDAELSANTYEVGVKLTNIKGYHPEFADGAEAKVIITKESYAAGVKLVGEDGNKVSFERMFFGGKVLSGDELKYSVKAVLDRPARADVKVDLALAGLEAADMSNIQLIPSELTIPAGTKESTESAVWTMSDAIMGTEDNSATWEMALSATATSDDEYVAMSEDAEQNTVVMTVDKVINAIRTMQSLEDLIGARVTDRSGWKCDAANSTNLFDGNTDTSWDLPEEGSGVLTIDLGKEYNISALRIGSNSSYSAGYIYGDIAISKDGGQTYGKIGKFNVGGNALSMDSYYRVVAFYGTIATRYLQLTLSSSSMYSRFLTEIDIFEGDKEAVVYAVAGTDNVATGKIAHTPTGAVGALNLSFPVRTNIPSDKGYTVNVAADDALIATYNSTHSTSYEALPAANLKIEGSPATIAANAYKSAENVTVSLTGDLSQFKSENGYLVPLKISATGVASSAKQGVVWVVITPETSNFMSGPTAGDITGSLADRSAWKVTTPDGASLGTSIIDGDTYSSSNQRTFVIDFGSVAQVTALKFACRYANYGSYYDASKVRISKSDDGVTFTSLGETDSASWYTSYGEHTIVPYGSISTRYIKLEVLECGSYYSYYGMAEFCIYAN